ncbi:MAG TPA: cation transporter [Planctomycetota bacterium]|nr:cation transporter [Planctomycetota bacterium]
MARMIVTLKVKGIACGHCVKTIQQTLSQMRNVKNIKIDRSCGVVAAEIDETLTRDDLAAAIADAGFEVED